MDYSDTTQIKVFKYNMLKKAKLLYKMHLILGVRKGFHFSKRHKLKPFSDVFYITLLASSVC